MALPNEKLILNLNTDELTIDDMILFEEGGFKASLFKEFLSRHSNWTAKQVGAITVKEMRDVSQQIADTVKEASLPKEIAPASADGQI